MVARLLQPISQAGITIEEWSPNGSRLAHSKHVHRHTDLAAEPAERARQLSLIAKGLTDRDWVIVGTDDDLYELHDLAADDPLLSRLLPVRAHQGALDSKAAMAEGLDRFGVRQPVWTVANTTDDVAEAVAGVGGHAMVKSVRGYGGSQVTEIRVEGRTMPLRGAPPYLVQEFVPGETVSIDLVVVNGSVALAPYSQMLTLASPRGISCARLYCPLDDDGLLLSLDRLAAGFGGTWLANVTAIRKREGHHEIVEVDPRPNAWHAYLPRLGFPLPQVLSAISAGITPTPHASSTKPHTRVVNVSRVIKSTLSGSPRQVRWLVDPRMTWPYAHRGDPQLTVREVRDLVKWLFFRNRGRETSSPPRS